MPLLLQVPSHCLQRIQSSYLQFSVQGIGLEVPEENSDSTHGVGAANQTQATASLTDTKPGPGSLIYACKELEKLSWGCLGWEGWVGWYRFGGSQAGLCGFNFFLTGKERGWRKMKSQHVCCLHLVLLWLLNLSFSMHLDKATDSDNSLSSPPDLYYGCEILCARDK